MVIELHHIKKHFGAVHAVDGVDLMVSPGQTLSIVGESGCGKTTLAKIMVGLLRPDEGNVIVDGKIQMVFQDPYNSLDPLWTVHRILEEAIQITPRFLPLDGGGKVGVNEPTISPSLTLPTRGRESGKKFLSENMLRAVDLSPDALNRFPHEFSGGERQRIAIARALLTQPSVLVLDEAVSALDVLVQRQILTLLKKIKAEFQLTYIFISHNLRVVKGFSDTIAVMHQGKIIEQASREAIFTNPKHPYTQQLLKSAFDYV